MSKTEVTIEMNAQDAQQAQAWARQRKYIADVERGLDAVARAGRRAGKESEDAFGGLGKKLDSLPNQLGAMVGKFFAINTAAQLFRKEIDGIKMKNENALQSQLEIATAQRKAVLSLGHGADLKPQQLISMMEGQRFVQPATAYLAAESAISGAGPLGAKRGADTVLAAAEFAPHLGADDLRHVVSGSLELQKSFKEYNPRQAVAQVFQAMALDRSEDAGHFSKNVITGIAQSRAFGGGKDSFGFLSSFFSAISQRAGDPYGQVSRTGGINFLEQMLTEGVGSGLFKKGTPVEKQLEAVRSSDPRAVAIRNKLLGALSDDIKTTTVASKKEGSDGALHTRAQTMIALSEMLQTGSPTAKMVEQFKARSAGTPAQVLSRQEELAASVNALPGQQAFAGQRILDTGMTALRNDPSRALKAVRQELVQGLYEAGGKFKTFNDAGAFFDAAAAEVEDLTPAQQFRAMAGKIAPTRKTLEGPKQVFSARDFGDMYGGSGLDSSSRPASPSELASAAALKRMETLLQKQAELLEKQLGIMAKDGGQPRVVQPRQSPAGRISDK